MKYGTIITKAEFSRQLGVTKARISQLVSSGMPVLANGNIDRHAALLWIKSHAGRPNRGGKVKSDGVLSAAEKLLAADGEALAAKPSLPAEAGDDRFDGVLNISAMARSAFDVGIVLCRAGVSGARKLTDAITAHLVAAAGRFCDDLADQGDIPLPLSADSWREHPWFQQPEPITDDEWAEIESEAAAA